MYSDELVDIKVLSVIQMHHIKELLVKFPIGIKVLFTHEIQQWQKSYNQKYLIAVTPTIHLPVKGLPTIEHTTPTTFNENKFG